MIWLHSNRTIQPSRGNSCTRIHPPWSIISRTYHPASRTWAMTFSLHSPSRAQKPTTCTAYYIISLKNNHESCQERHDSRFVCESVQQESRVSIDSAQIDLAHSAGVERTQQQAAGWGWAWTGPRASSHIWSRPAYASKQALIEVPFLKNKCDALIDLPMASFVSCVVLFRGNFFHLQTNL